jgi:O-antigen/teichoic acid export membrane protein
MSEPKVKLNKYTGKPPVANKRIAAFANFFFGLGGIGFNIFSGLLFVPIYLRHIDDATYGIWLASAGLVSMLGLLESGLSMVYVLKLAPALDMKEVIRVASLTGAGLVIAVMTGLLILMLGAVLAWFAPIILRSSPDNLSSLRVAIILSALGVGLVMPSHIFSAIPQACQRTIVQGTITLIAMTSGLLTILVALRMNLGVVALGFGPVAFGLVMLCGNAVNSLCIWREFEFPRPRFEGSTVKELLRETRQLLLARTSATIANNLQPPAAALAVSAEASVVMGLTGRMASLVTLFSDRLSSAVFSGVTHITQQSKINREKILREIITITTIFSGVGISLSFCFTKPVMRLWVGEQRYTGDLIFGMMLLGSFLGVRQVAYSNLISALGGIQAASRWLAADAYIKLFFMLLLAPLAGLLGIACASVISSLFVVVGLSRLMANAANISLKSTWRMGGYGALISLLFGVTWRVVMPSPDEWSSIIWQFLVCCGLMIASVTACDRGWRMALMHNLCALNLMGRFIGRRSRIVA